MKENKTPINPFFIVAIGASAGGLEAVTQLLKNLSPDTGMAYVYIQHLDPTHESMLSAILGRETKMKVVEAAEQLRIEPDHVYVIPPNRDMEIADGVFTITPRKAKPIVHMPIDHFCFSLAEKQKEASIGILLSGNASDGTLGLKAIKTAGGLTFAQDDSAQFKSMPHSANAEGAVDMVLPPAKIADELKRISKQAGNLRLVLPEDKEENEKEEEISIGTDEEFNVIIQLIKKSTGIDFTHYKINTIRRRIIRRMLLHKLETLSDYIKFLRANNQEIKVLYNDLLINVTSFFRETDAMEYLQHTVFPAILKNKIPNNPVRIWVPACSTGEEAYSLAIVLVETLGEKITNTPVQIFATDISELAITKARAGVYSPSTLANVSPKRLQRYFTKIDGSYRIIKSIRDLCVFAPHNIFRDPPFSRMNLISCCNLMIYLDNVLQKKVLGAFYYALNNNGYLMLGKSETTGNSTLFVQSEKKYKIYAKRQDISAATVLELDYNVHALERPESSFSQKTAAANKNNVSALEKSVESILLTKYIPPCVVINGDMEILQFRGATSLFLEHPTGRASFNLIKMARPELTFELNSAIHKSLKTGEPVKRAGIQLKDKTTIHSVSIEVLPIKMEIDEKLLLVVFEELKESPVPVVNDKLTKDKYIKELQEELNRVREDMRAHIEEQEASNEELQSANEEIVSSNEELQSINEELETSKEEVESTNEELMTINSELQVRNEQLSESYEYAEAMFSIIREAVIVLDENLKVRSANDAFYSIFKLSEEAVQGRLIYELGDHQWNISNLRQLLYDVVSRNEPISGLKITHYFPGIGEKILILSTKKVIQKTHNEQLILLAFEDITEHQHAERLLEEREAWFHNMADNAPVMIWVADTNKQMTFFNKNWLDFTGRRPEEESGTGWIENIHKEDIKRVLKEYNTCFDKKELFHVEFRLNRYDGEQRWVMFTGKPTFSTDGNFTGYIGTSTDIDEQKHMVDKLDKLVSQRTFDLQEINKELQRSNSELEQFAYVASHDLQEPLRKIMTFSDRLQTFNEVLPDLGKKYIEKIEASTHRMSQLIDDLLNFSSSTRADKKFTQTDLDKILKLELADFEVIANQKKASINADKLPEIEAIPVQMEQLFHNLISNALKFSKEDEAPVITISVREVPIAEIDAHPELESSVPHIEIIFKDNGIGFSPEFAEQIFVIFQRLNEKRNSPGTGIGLALCRKIVNNHGGKIYAESSPNEGTAFHIILPKKVHEP
jgi:two-component system CheB/CheR fusion protein